MEVVGSIPTIPEWAKLKRDVCLYDYQIDDVNSLSSREAEITTRYSIGEVAGHASLTEPFGSGKTFIVFGLLQKDPMPPINDKEIRLYECLPAHYCSFKLTYPNQLIRPTAIVVSRSVYAQWVEKLAQYTSFHVYKAKDRPAVNTLITMITKDGTVHNYDIVLIKYGKVKDSAETADLCSVINRATSSMVWSRVIYDDIDFIHECMCLRAISSIFITGATDFTYYPPYVSAATRKRIRIPNSTRELLTKLPSINHVFVSGQNRAYGGTARRIWAICGHDPAMIARQHGIYAMQWMKCCITNNDIRNASNLIGNITAVDCAELLRMMNGDAMVSAATMLHATTVTPYAMFAKVLGVQRQDYETSQARLQICKLIREIPHDKRQIREKNDTMRYMSPRELQISEEILTIAIATSQTLHHFNVSDLISTNDDLVNSTIRDLESYIARMDRSFERIQENLSSQICSVCCSDLVGLRVVIMRCCGYVVCSQCCVLASHFAQRGDKVCGLCIQCRSRVDLTKDIVFVDSTVNPATLIEDIRKHTTNADDIVNLSKMDSIAINVQEHNNDILTKVNYIVELVSGAKINETPHLRISNTKPDNVVGLMNGTQYVEPTRRKYLICSQFDETLDEIAVALQERNIKFALLQGSVSDFAGIITRYANNVVDVMMLNVRLLYAGVDLQMTTDIIIINAQGTENLGQIIGRAQRIGRTCSLTVHMLEYVGNVCEEHRAVVRGARNAHKY